MIDTTEYSWARPVLAACALVVAACYVIMCFWTYHDRRNRTPKLSWIVAVGMVVATFSISGAAIVFTERLRMPSKIAAEQRVEAAFAKQRVGDFAGALDLYVQADNMGADPRRALYRAAECCLYLKRYDDAMNLCDTLASRVERSGAAHHVRGLVFEAMGDSKRAHEEWELAVSYGWVPARLKLGKV